MARRTTARTRRTGGSRTRPKQAGPQATGPAESGTEETGAQQERSRRTADRITAAALALLERTAFEDLSVADIARRAGVSVGGFYARFPSKDALLQYFHATVIESIVAAASRELDPERLAGRSARDVVAVYIGLAVSTFRAHRVVLQQVALRSRTSRDPSFRGRIREANRFLHGRFRALLEERRSELAHPDPSRAVDLGLTFVSGAMREYVLFAEYRTDFEPIPDEALVQELTDAFCAYARVRPARRRRTRT